MNTLVKKNDLDKRIDTIRDWWESPETVSLIDENLRELETEFVLSCLEKGWHIADMGCGGGESTQHYAQKAKHCVALERSNHLRGKAQELFSSVNISNVELVNGDILDTSAYDACFDGVVTQRVLINMADWNEQQRAIDNVSSCLKSGGLYIALENTIEGHEALNEVRKSAGLSEIKVHHWHNYFLSHDRFHEYMKRDFNLERTHNFNLYYMLTRVFTNMFAKFDGFGVNAKKDTIFTQADRAARELYGIMNDKVKINVPTGDSFGPIQGFVFRKK